MKLKPVFASGKKQLIPFITCGFPLKKETVEIIKLFLDSGIKIIELGVPFSDPVADGPTIQYSSYIALQNRVNLGVVFDIIEETLKYQQYAAVVMTYLNPVVIYGIEKFFYTISQLGVSGIIFPDIIPEEKDIFFSYSQKYSVDTIFLLTALTQKFRRKLVYKYSTGFVYLVTLTGTTGAREVLPKYFYNFVKTVRKETDKPLCAGFGIAKPQHVLPVIDYIDGFIIGSAFIDIIRNYSGSQRYKQLKKFISQFNWIIQ